MMLKRNVVVWLGALWVATVGSGGLMGQAMASQVEVPAGVLAPGTSFVMWADAEGFNEQAMSQTLDAVIAVAPAADQERMRAEAGETLAKMRPVFDAADQLRADGVQSAVIAVAPQADPAAQPLTQVFLKAGAGADPKASIAKTARSINTWMLESGEGQPLPPEELEAQLEGLTVTQVNDHWHAVEFPEGEFAPLPAAEEAADPAPFAEALSSEDGAPVRFAWIMNASNRQALQQAATDPNNMMMAGLITPLTSLETATGGLWLGEQPKLRVSMNFADEASASQFKTSTDGMIGFFGQMIAMSAAQNPEAGGEAPDPAKIQAVLPLLYLDNQGAVVSKTLDTGMLTQLSEAGIPWSNQ